MDTAPGQALETLTAFSLLGTSACLFAPATDFDVTTQRRILALAALAAHWPGIQEAVPGVTNLMLLFSSPPRDPAALATRLEEAWAATPPAEIVGRHIEVPVVYGGAGGPHLDDVVRHTGLSVDEVIAIHTAPVYTVFALGSHPGYCYLGGMDARLFVPRREVPLLSIPKGSLSVAGMQTGVAASAGPSGWHTIGLVDMDFFDPRQMPPSLFTPGDTLRFVVERVIR
ncbi:MAG: 5-oxoprolinase subunit PxpB [Devosia sp.]|nr:5-oxoprolinase subunit PxpB [Devosia sp.]